MTFSRAFKSRLLTRYPSLLRHSACKKHQWSFQLDRLASCAGLGEGHHFGSRARCSRAGPYQAGRGCVDYSIQAHLSRRGEAVDENFETGRANHCEMDELFAQNLRRLSLIQCTRIYSSRKSCFASQVMVPDSRSDHETASCTQVVSDFCTAAASGLQLLFAGALAPDATTVRLCAETQRSANCSIRCTVNC